MTGWKRAADLFDGALALPPEQRGEFLEEACQGDPELLREVKELLLYHEQSRGFLERSALEAEARRSAAEAEALLPQEQLGPYRILAELGRGGMGIVYKVEDTRSGEIKVLKILSPALTADPQSVRRFRREARAASTLSHPGINRVLEADEAEGHHFIVTDYAEGEPLSSHMGKPWDPRRAMEVVRSISDALSAAHRKGIAHRDIKPSNILITSSGDVKILDFGIAKGFDSGLSGSSLSTTSLTSPGTLVGTVDYMSPEQLRGRTVDARSDIFSLGTVFYEMLSGVHPFKTERPLETSANVLSLHPLPVARYSPRSPEALQRVLGRMLAKDRKGRYSSLASLQRDLEAILEGREPDSHAHPLRRSLWWVFPVVAALIFLAWALYRTVSS